MYKFKYQIYEINYSGTSGNPKHPDFTCASRTKLIYQKIAMSTLEYSYTENHQLCKHSFILDLSVKVRQFSHSLHSQGQDKIFLNKNLQT